MSLLLSPVGLKNQHRIPSSGKNHGKRLEGEPLSAEDIRMAKKKKTVQKKARTVRTPLLRCAMTRIDVSLPETLKEAAEMVSDDQGFSTVSEYVRDLIRADVKGRGFEVETQFPKKATGRR